MVPAFALSAARKIVEIVAVKEIIAQHQARRIVSEEISADKIKPAPAPAAAAARRRNLQPQLAPILEEPAELRQIHRSGNDQYLPDAASNQTESG